MFQNGIQKFHEELDTVDILQTIRQMKTLSKLVLTQHQNSLLNFQSSNLVGDQIKSDEPGESCLKSLKYKEDSLTYEHLPSYLKNSTDSGYKASVDLLVEKAGTEDQKFVKIWKHAFNLDQDTPYEPHSEFADAQLESMNGHKNQTSTHMKTEDSAVDFLPDKEFSSYHLDTSNEDAEQDPGQKRRISKFRR
jgi:hypothetical protein